MTIKERFMAIFAKPIKVRIEDLQEDFEVDKELEIDDDIKRELELWDSVNDDFTLLEEAKEIVLSTTTKDLEAEFELQYPGKHAIWRGNETKAFIKYKEELGE